LIASFCDDAGYPHILVPPPDRRSRHLSVDLLWLSVARSYSTCVWCPFVSTWKSISFSPHPWGVFRRRCRPEIHSPLHASITLIESFFPNPGQPVASRSSRLPKIQDRAPKDHALILQPKMDVVAAFRSVPVIPVELNLTRARLLRPFQPKNIDGCGYGCRLPTPLSSLFFIGRIRRNSVLSFSQ